MILILQSFTAVYQPIKLGLRNALVLLTIFLTAGDSSHSEYSVHGYIEAEPLYLSTPVSGRIKMRHDGKFALYAIKTF